MGRKLSGPVKLQSVPVPDTEASTSDIRLRQVGGHHAQGFAADRGSYNLPRAQRACVLITSESLFDSEDWFT